MVNTFTPSFTFSPENHLDRLPPENIDAEEAILGAILLDPTAIGRIKMLKPEHFYVLSHKLIYEAAIKLSDKHQPTDLISIMNYLVDHGQLERVGGRNKLAHLLSLTVSSVNIDHLASLVIQKAVRRQLISLSNEMNDLAYRNEIELPEIFSTIKQKTNYLNDCLSMTSEDDSDKWHYARLLEKLQEIHMKTTDPGLKEYKLQELAKRNGKSTRELEYIYQKSLCATVEERRSLQQIETELGATSRKWLLNGLLPAATTVLLYADGGVGKTKFMYDLMYSLAAGENWNNFPVTAANRRVLLYQGDESKSDMLQALNQRGFSSGTDVRERLEVRFGWNTDAMSILIKDLEEYDPDIVVIDSLSFVSRFSIYDENKTEYSRPILELNKLAAQYGKTIVIIHHANRQGSARGATAIKNAVSEVLKLERDTAPNANAQEKILTIEKSRSRRFPAQYRLFFNEEDFSLTLLEEVGQALGSPDLTTKERILKFLQQENNRNVRFESEEISHQINASNANTRRCLNLLARDGLINCDSRLASGVAKKYYIDYDTNLKEGYLKVTLGDHVSIQGDHLAIALYDRLPNPSYTSDSAKGDQVITKNTTNSLSQPQGKNSDFDDRLITLARKDCTAEVYEAIVQGDREVIVGDQAIAKNITNSVSQPGGKISDFGDQMITVARKDCTVEVYEVVFEGDRLEVEGDRLEVEGDRLEVEGDRLEVEGDRLEVEGDRPEVEGDHPLDVVQKPINDFPTPPPYEMSVEGRLGKSTAVITLVKAHKNSLKVTIDYTFPDGTIKQETLKTQNLKEAQLLVKIEITRWEEHVSQMLPSPLPSNNMFALGDEVIPLEGKYKGKALTVALIDSAGIWTRENKKSFSPSMGPFQPQQLKRHSGDEQ